MCIRDRDGTGILSGSGVVEVDKALNLVEIVNKTDYDLVLNDIIFWDADTSAPPVTHISSNGHTYPLVFNPSGSPPLLDVDNGWDDGTTVEGGAGDVRFNGEIRNPGGTNDVLNQGGDIENCMESGPLEYACSATPDISGQEFIFNAILGEVGTASRVNFVVGDSGTITVDAFNDIFLNVTRDLSDDITLVGAAYQFNQHAILEHLQAGGNIDVEMDGGNGFLSSTVPTTETITFTAGPFTFTATVTYDKVVNTPVPVSYTHLTLPTIYSV